VPVSDIPEYVEKAKALNNELETTLATNQQTKEKTSAKRRPI
jgi:hypothetical protein